MKRYDVTMHKIARSALLCVAMLLTTATASAIPRDPAGNATPRGLLRVALAQLDADYWIARLRDPNRVVLDAAGIAARNATLRARDPSWNDIESLPATLDGAQVRAWIEQRSARPARALFDEAGKQGSERQIDKLMRALDLDAIPKAQVTRFGMIVRRANLRTFPTQMRVFSAPGDRDIDRFQETALFAGTPVVIAQDSRDRQWVFVVSPLYTGWIERSAVAEGDRRAIFAVVHAVETIVVTGAHARTAFTPEAPGVSRFPLEMGMTLPLQADASPDQPINGQLAYAARVVLLPQRNEDGSLRFANALLPRSEDAREGVLPLTKANLLRQAFKFLGERYGWGNDYDARDCSGFVAQVYATFGVLMPRNTSDQARSPAYDPITLDDSATHVQRLEALRRLQVGDLIYIPGHVMLVIGSVRGEPWVIHDVQGVGARDASGNLVRMPLNGVSVTPFLALQADDTHGFVDRITSIVRIRPATGSN